MTRLTMRMTTEAEHRIPGTFLDQKGTLGSDVWVMKFTVFSLTCFNCIKKYFHDIVIGIIIKRIGLVLVRGILVWDVLLLG